MAVFISSKFTSTRIIVFCDTRDTLLVTNQKQVGSLKLYKSHGISSDFPLKPIQGFIRKNNGPF